MTFHQAEDTLYIAQLLYTKMYNVMMTIIEAETCSCC